jgi:ribosomal protein S27E
MTSSDFEIHKITCPECGTVNSVMSNAIMVTTPIDCSKCHLPLGMWGEARMKYGTPPKALPEGA